MNCLVFALFTTKFLNMFEYKKEGKGHCVYFNGEFIFWVTGSLKHAKKEALKHK